MKSKADEFKDRLQELVLQIRDEYLEEYPDGDYLRIFVRKHYVSFNNSYWDGDEQFPINGCVYMEDYDE